MDHKLLDLIDRPRLQELFDSLYEAFGLGTAIIDNDGNILIASGWQDICTKFHRAHPICAKQCTKSDLHILSQLNEGWSSVTYKCPQRLVDSATPIMIGGKHLGTIYIGQFLLEAADIEQFREQARKYEFDEDAYLEALSRVPILNNEQLEQRLKVIRMLTEFVGEMGLERWNEIENRQRLAEAERIARLGSWEFYIAAKCMMWSDEIYRILGTEPQEYPPSREAFVDVVHPDDRARINKAFVRSLEQGTPYNIEYQVVRRSDGEIRHINEICECVKDKSGKVDHLLGMVHDITERKCTQEALSNSERRLADIINFLPDATFAIDIDGKIIAWNRAVEEMTGVRAEDMIGRGDYEYAIPFHGKKQPMLIGLVLHPHEYDEQLHSLFIREGNTILGEAYNSLLGVFWWGKASPLYDPEGNVVGAIESVRDITNNKLAERELRRSEEKYRSLVENTSDWVWEVDENYALTYTSPRVHDILGYDAEEIIGQTLWDFATSEEKKRITIILDRAISTKIQLPLVDHEMIHRDGHRVYMQASCKLMFDEHGVFSGCRGIDRDVSQRKRAEEERRQMKEHLEAHKRLFYRNSILSVTNGKLEICERADIDRYISNGFLITCVTTMQDVSMARRRTREFCNEHGLFGDRLDSFLNGVGEAVANAIKHGAKGTVFGGCEADAVWVAVTDKGNGIESLILPQATLGRGFSTKRSMGLGYTIILDVADHVLLNTGPNGTNVLMIKNLVEPSLEVSLESLPDTWK